MPGEIVPPRPKIFETFHKWIFVFIFPRLSGSAPTRTNRQKCSVLCCERHVVMLLTSVGWHSHLNWFRAFTMCRGMSDVWNNFEYVRRFRRQSWEFSEIIHNKAILLETLWITIKLFGGNFWTIKYKIVFPFGNFSRQWIRWETNGPLRNEGFIFRPRRKSITEKLLGDFRGEKWQAIKCISSSS